ncbi:MAG: ATP-binding protein [Bacteroidales bacterium]|nr:ATP-binding protein [Bacteroidales bacterium]
MDTPFIYDRFVTGKNFIGRKTECTIMSNLLESGENVMLYGRPKSGKMSIVQQTLFNRRLSGKQFMVAHVCLSNVRNLEHFLLKFGTAVIKSVSSTADEYESLILKYLDGTHFVFDRARFASCDEVVSMNWTPDMNDVYKMIRLPHRIAEERGRPYYVILEDFQNIMLADEYEEVFKTMEELFRERSRSVSFILIGSQVNAMKYIFEEKKYFYRLVEKLPMSAVDDREIIEYIVKGFMVSGKVIERDLVLGACKLFRGDMWYLNHFISICDTMSRGFINEGILMEALRTIISIHEPRFYAIVNDLTDHQLSLLLAVLDGVVRFSASDVIEKYRLNSSANVRRVKDALKKKEVITFNEKDEPVILDPLFEYWVSNNYFERR